jgi:ankyrin repeat protein
MFASQNGRTPLHEAALNGHVDACRFLVLKLHADVNVRNQVCAICFCACACATSACNCAMLAD